MKITLKHADGSIEIVEVLKVELDAIVAPTEPVVVAPAPEPEPVVVAPAPPPEPVAVAPITEPAPAPIVVEPTPVPAPEPVPEPIIVAPTPAPVPVAAPTADVFALGVGMNMGEPQDYQGEHVFFNAFDQTRGWQSWGNYMQNRPGMDRVITWSGAGTLSVENVDLIVSRAPNRIVYRAKADVPFVGGANANLDGGSVLLKRSGDVTNVRDVPLAAESSTAVFNPMFIDRLAPAKIMRFMDWTRTNNSKVKEWADRAQPAGRASRVAGGNVCLEDIISLANTAKKHPWICVPHLASNDYVVQLAKMLKASLDAALVPIIEFSNETWNGSFTQYRELAAEATLQGIAGDEYTRVALLVGRRTKQIRDLMLPIDARCKFVAGGQIGSSYQNEKLFEGAGAGVFDAMSVAPYLARGGSWSTADAAIAAFNSAVDSELNLVRSSQKVAAKYGVKYISYEGGNHCGNSAGGYLAQRDPRMYDVYMRLLRGWRDASGGLFVHFNNAYLPTQYGYWGALEYTSQPLEEAPKYRALRDFAANPLG